MKKNFTFRRPLSSILSIMLAFIMVFSTPVPAMAAAKYVKSLKISKTSVTVNEGKSVSLKATVSVKGKASKAVKVTSSNSSTASVSVGKPNSKGVSEIKIKGIKAGKATITVKTSGKNKKKKAMTKKINVNVKADESISSSESGPYSLNYTSYTLIPGQEIKLEVLKDGQTASDASVFWGCSDYKICNVSSSDGRVIAKAEGDVVVTASIDGKYELTCRIHVGNANDVSSDFDYSRDVTVTTGTKNVHIEFKINKDAVTEDELKDLGYNVEGGNASADVTCETATYTFTNLPKTLGDIQQFDLSTKFGPMAASICALTTWQDMNIQNDGMYKNPIWDMFEYINGPKSEIKNATKSSRYPSMQQTLNKGKYCYFEGASNTNNYTPSKPLSFTMYHGPYMIPAKSSTIAHPEGEPERHMILISFGGDDSERYIDVYQSSDGNWYSYEDQWSHLIASIKDVAAAW